MGIFDIFTGSSAKKAAEQNARLYAQYGREAQGYIDDSVNRSTGALDTGLARASDVYRTSAGQAVDALGTGLDRQIGALNRGLTRADAAYGRAVDAYTPLGEIGAGYSRAGTLAMDALGANGADAAAAARGAFTSSPGYQYQVDQATDAVARKAAALGLTASGNTMAEIGTRAQQLANQDWGGWLDRLKGYSDSGLSATGAAAAGRAGVEQNRAGMYSADAAARSGAYGANASGLSSLWSGYGNTMGGLYSNDAAARAGLYTGAASTKANVAGNVASGAANSNTAAANAQMQSSANFWGGLMNLAGSFAPKMKG
ncbi:hypothetical protein [Rhodoplanes serenus]|uniref:hypothetical protein n=1 Tax=Rhodoplanes serenus TaxID=200615 RepID=UPI000DACBA5E|nr:hypothetical protein [Rhodoplanes serenus]RAI28275.1 hypothetical protein CH340_23725 [Rhodoplanes serenus]